MAQFSSRVIIHSTRGYHAAVDVLVEEFRRSGVRFIGVTGVDCQFIEDMIDELVVGDGSLDEWDVTTTSHPGESLPDVVAFVDALSIEAGTDVQVIEI